MTLEKVRGKIMSPVVLEDRSLTIYDQIRKYGVPITWGQPSLDQVKVLDKRGLAPAQLQVDMEGGRPVNGV